MPAAKPITAIEFEYRDWANGFYLTFRIPYTPEDYQAVLAMRNSANIRLIK